MYLLVEKPENYPAYAPIALVADNGHDAYEEAAKRFETIPFESSVLYEMDEVGNLTVRARFLRAGARELVEV